MSQYAFLVDTGRCIKCWACQVACKQWNGIEAGTVTRRQVRETVEGVFPTLKRTFQSMACNHCAEPACVANCPAGAITKRDEDGAVVVDKQACIGCQTCARVCPFGVPNYEPQTGIMDKCDACVSCGRTPDKDLPHCVATCPTQALKWGVLEDIEALAAEKGGARMEGETAPCVFVVR